MQRISLAFLWGLFGLLLVAFVPWSDACTEDCPPPPERPPDTQPNPAIGWTVTDTGTPDNLLAAFGRRPLDEPWIIPFGGDYQDPDRGRPHYGIDYTFPELFYQRTPQPVYPIGPGVVTALHACPSCWAFSTDPEWADWGRLRTGALNADNLYGFGAIVVLEHPYNEAVSFYTLYAHLRDIRVWRGQIVTSEQPLGLMGASGDVAAPHVHLEVRIGAPGLFWGADFSQPGVIRRWTELRHITPVYLLFEHHHIPFTRELELWTATQAQD
ncbi:MAG: M23 family metallopeptidase [Anaerolineales bacterium]